MQSTEQIRRRVLTVEPKIAKNPVDLTGILFINGTL